MALIIKWNKIANKDLDSILFFLEKEWSQRVIHNFVKILNSKLDLISLFPLLGSHITGAKNIRAIIITKHSRMYYRINKNIIIILRLFDTRKDPANFKL